MNNKDRAHDLAVSYAQYKNIAEFFENDSSLKFVSLEADFFSDYQSAYEDFLSRLEEN